MELFRIAFGATLTDALVVNVSSIAAFGVLDIDLQRSQCQFVVETITFPASCHISA